MAKEQYLNFILNFNGFFDSKMALNDHYLFSRTSVFEPLIVLMTSVTNKSLFFTVNGFNPKLSALKINFIYLMHIFMGF